MADNRATCVYCADSGTVELYRTVAADNTAYGIRCCHRCRCHFLSPQPDAAQLRRAYRDDYYGAAQSKFGPLIELLLRIVRRRAADRAARELRPGSAVLDVGCGSGGFLREMIAKGFSAVGIERPGLAAERAKQLAALRLIEGAFPDVTVEDQFGLVTLWHVLEHLPEPKKALARIAGLVAPGGRLVIAWPNIESFQSRLFKGKWFHLDPPRHLFFFPTSRLIEELAPLGLHCVGVRNLSFAYNPFGIQQSLLNTLSPERDFLYESLKSGGREACRDRAVRCWAERLFFVATFPIFVVIALFEAMLKSGGTVELVFVKAARSTSPPAA